MRATEYRALYEDYWSRADRWGSCSFRSAEALAAQILSVCGSGRLLDVGCGMGTLVRTLLMKGMDVRGVDVAERPVRHLNSLMPGRFHLGSILDLPFAAGSFETVVCTDVLEHLEEQDVPRALRELRRVARRCCFLAIATAPDRDNRWHLTVHGRDWWENLLFEAGFRKHPRYYHLNAYELIETELSQAHIPMEVIPTAAAEAYPVSWLRPERDLHMDMLRETGRRSDGHTVRYVLAAELVRPGDVVLDAACGMGYGAHLIRATTRAAQVIGLDSSQRAIDYARACFATGVNGLEFRAGDAQDLSFLPDHSVDLVVSFETLEHLPEPERLLAEAYRVLRPGGRIIVSVPNRWVDHTGTDPNPYHLHVYDWQKLRDQMGRQFLLERAHRQIAGNGFILSDRARILREVPVETEPAEESEWWIMTGSVDPTGGKGIPYQELFYAYSRPPENLLAFARDYSNPWLVRSLVEYPTRLLSAHNLKWVAEKVLAESAPQSADEGAALCVMGYRMLEDASESAVEVERMIARLDQYVSTGSQQGHYLRWRISLAFLRGQLLLKLGAFRRAEEAFSGCAAMDCAVFSPTLGTKTVLAHFMAGWLAWIREDVPVARACWTSGIQDARRLLQGDWLEFVGRPDNPLPFPLVTAVELLDTAVMCANGLRWTAPGGRSTAYGDWPEIHQCWNAMLGERWRAMQAMEEVIRDRSVTISTQARTLEERWAIIQNMERLIADRDQAIAAQTAMIEERWTIMQRMEEMIRERDVLLSRQGEISRGQEPPRQDLENLVAAQCNALSVKDGMIAKQAEAIEQARTDLRSPSFCWRALMRAVAARVGLSHGSA